MTRDETKQLLTEIEQLYPESFQKVNTITVVELWTEALRDETYDKMHGYLMQYVKDDAKGYAPKVGQLLALKPEQYDDRGLEDWGFGRSV